jgi:hypothetical protein
MPQLPSIAKALLPHSNRSGDFQSNGLLDFGTDPIRRSRSTVCSSEPCRDRVWVSPTVENRDNVDDGFFDPVVDGKWKPLRHFAVQAEDGRVYSCFGLEATKILEQTVREVVTEAFVLLLLVEPGARSVGTVHASEGMGWKVPR